MPTQNFPFDISIMYNNWLVLKGDSLSICPGAKLLAVNEQIFQPSGMLKLYWLPGSLIFVHLPFPIGI